MQIAECYKVGYILKPHGLKGEVTVSLEPDGPEDFSEVETVFVDQKNHLVPFFIQSVSQSGSKAYIKFDDIDSVDAAFAITKSAMYLPKSTRPKSGRGDFYDDEIVGFTVVDKDLGELGKVGDVEQAGPNKLLLVHYNHKEVLIPVNGPFIIGINKSKKVITVLLPEGFLEI
jgi:16S rRNA processing protein RimM